jgi:glycosyltransferase involved in cell wall biosynthesis
VRILHVGYGFRPWRHGGLIAYAEDAMEGQAARGHEVAYFFRGRHYPGLRDDRLRRWRKRGVLMHEILNSSLVFGGDSGTLTPEADLDHPPSEAHFAAVLDAFRPDVVHLQEVLGLPTSVIDLARARAVPVVATLQDYLPLCPVLRLYDVDHRICLRHDVGEQCARCSARAPAGRSRFARMTVGYELRRLLGGRADLLGRRRRPARPESEGELPRERAPSASRYQRRRDVNVQRLSRLDAAVAQSRRVAEIYAQLGVDESCIRVLDLTLRHLESMTVTAIDQPPERVRFATVNGASSVQKGAEVLIGALAELEDAGLAGRFTLVVLGHVPEENRKRFGRFASVDLRGWYDPGRVDDALSGVDVGIVPSVWEEAYGYIGPEFLAKGIPVIGNARGGIVDYTRDGETGWLNRDASAAGLAAIMADIIRRPGQVPERSRWIRAHREEIIKPFERHLDELDSLYREAIAGAERRKPAAGAV